MFSEASAFYIFDHLTSNVMLPLAGFMLAGFVGWKLPISFLAEEVRLELRAARMLQILLRYLIPASIGIVSLFPLFGIK